MKVEDILKKDDDRLLIALSYLLEKSKTYLILNSDMVLSDKIIHQIKTIEDKINDGYPLQYAIGKWEFYGLELNVDERALIPRFETEIIVDYILNSDYKKNQILDIGLGSGAISLSLAKNLPDYQITGVDISEDALELAEFNRKKLGIANASFIQSDLFENINNSYDIIVSNPPYVSSHDYSNLSKELYYEPKLALVGGNDGLDLYRKIIKDANNYLNDKGHLIFEIGYDQKERITELLIKSNFKNIENLKDHNDFDRFIIAEKG